MMRLNHARRIVGEETQRIRCRDGWIYCKPQAGGRYYVTATGYRAQTVGSQELSGYISELVRALGGRARN